MKKVLVLEFGGQYYLLLLSAERPELSHLVAQFGTGEAPETRDYTSLLERMTPGSVWQFRLHGNPTYSSCTENARGKVHACTLIRRPDKLPLADCRLTYSVFETLKAIR